jgi:hypothetical protein
MVADVFLRVMEPCATLLDTAFILRLEITFNVPFYGKSRRIQPFHGSGHVDARVLQSISHGKDIIMNV